MEAILVMLRLAGCRLSCDFEVTDAAVDVEFVCDFVGMAGEVWFDADSFRVRRM